MALMVEHDVRLDSETRSRVAFHTSGLVLGKLLINALKKADVITRKRAVELEQHWFFQNCVFADLRQLVPNLAQSAESNTESTLRTRSVRRRHGHEVTAVMSSIAKKLGLGHDSLEARYMQKIRYNRKQKCKTGANIFLTGNHTAVEEENWLRHHEVIELALHMSKEEQWLQETGTGSEPVSVGSAWTPKLPLDSRTACSDRSISRGFTDEELLSEPVTPSYKLRVARPSSKQAPQTLHTGGDGGALRQAAPGEEGEEVVPATRLKARSSTGGQQLLQTPSSCQDTPQQARQGRRALLSRRFRQVCAERQRNAVRVVGHIV